MKILAFTKSFQHWPIPEVCRRFKEIGLDGLDLTVRKGGHIQPQDVAEQLPLAAKAALEAGLEIGMLTTGITEPDAEAEKLLATASKLGIHKIKLGYYRYKPFGTLVKQLDEIRRQLAAVAKLAAKYDVLPCVHTHCNDFIPSHGTQLYLLLKDLAPGQVGAYADMLHMSLEGGGDGWRQGLDLVAPWLAVVAVKNYDYQQKERDKRGQMRWRHLVVPVADGISPIPEFVTCLRKLGYDGMYSMHSEYEGSGSFRNMNAEECLKQTAVDLKYFKSLFG
jgi:sugar phosphate isomerase/epimerase